jgi:hypothetical protein
MTRRKLSKDVNITMYYYKQRHSKHTSTETLLGAGKGDQLFADFRFSLGILEHKLCEYRNMTVLHLLHCNFRKYARRIKLILLMHDLVITINFIPLLAFALFSWPPRSQLQ